MANLSKAMCISRTVRMTSGRGEAWFYISPYGLEIEVADEPDAVSSHSILITKQQLIRALQVIEEWRDG